ncbi:hypothetical protein B0H16DRAFT_1464399 [Mycena metata]|uniref:Uncharacterized protein n=1 Tax=Mycena metata TaxID=1033252 RepID=A0AAD7IF34_9AGAR|nr:hypothetical protein B0H16DRAFT_1464918 [Mycena metata]KAJ7741680.1 hypothetical protein B0H16DRAFT_1464399 [Mycena metata]
MARERGGSRSAFDDKGEGHVELGEEQQRLGGGLDGSPRAGPLTFSFFPRGFRHIYVEFAPVGQVERGSSWQNLNRESADAWQLVAKQNAYRGQIRTPKPTEYSGRQASAASSHGTEYKNGILLQNPRETFKENGERLKVYIQVVSWENDPREKSDERTRSQAAVRVDPRLDHLV